MSPGQRALQSFLTDGLRMASDTLVLLERMQALERVRPGAQSPEQVLRVFQVVHTIKGTATMIPEGGEIVRALQTFEALLACRSTEDSASRASEWLEDGIQALRSARSALAAIRLSHQGTLGWLSGGAASVIPLSSEVGQEPLGILLSVPRAQRSRRDRQVWVPIDQVSKVFDLQGVSRKLPWLCWDGCWVPVAGDLRSARILVGVRADGAPSGRLILASPRLEGVMTQAEAKARGAQLGLESLTAPKRRLRVA